MYIRLLGCGYEPKDERSITSTIPQAAYIVCTRKQSASMTHQIFVHVLVYNVAIPPQTGAFLPFRAVVAETAWR